MKNRFKLLCVALLVASAGAQAQTKGPSSGLYGELGLTQVKYSFAGYSVTPKVLRGIVGYEVNPNLALEGMVGLGVSDSSTTVLGAKATLDIDHMVGLYVKPRVAVSPELELFARIGVARSKATASASAGGWAATATGSDTDASYGLGMSYSFNKTTAVNVDYMSYYSKDGEKANGLTVGVGFKF